MLSTQYADINSHGLETLTVKDGPSIKEERSHK